jgi:hypothetical protein
VCRNETRIWYLPLPFESKRLCRRILPRRVGILWHRILPLSRSNGFDSTAVTMPTWEPCLQVAADQVELACAKFYPVLKKYSWYEPVNRVGHRKLLENEKKKDTRKIMDQTERFRTNNVASHLRTRWRRKSWRVSRRPIWYAPRTGINIVPGWRLVLLGRGGCRPDWCKDCHSYPKQALAKTGIGYGGGPTSYFGIDPKLPKGSPVGVRERRRNKRRSRK